MISRGKSSQGQNFRVFRSQSTDSISLWLLISDTIEDRNTVGG